MAVASTERSQKMWLLFMDSIRYPQNSYDVVASSLKHDDQGHRSGTEQLSKLTEHLLLEISFTFGSRMILIRPPCQGFSPYILQRPWPPAT